MHSIPPVRQRLHLGRPRSQRILRRRQLWQVVTVLSDLLERMVDSLFFVTWETEEFGVISDLTYVKVWRRCRCVYARLSGDYH